MSDDQKIARRAYELWQSSGHQGLDVDHWLEAERQILKEQQEAHATALADPETPAAPDETVAPGKTARARAQPKADTPASAKIGKKDPGFTAAEPKTAKAKKPSMDAASSESPGRATRKKKADA
jgi:hypothetical protein